MTTLHAAALEASRDEIPPSPRRWWWVQSLDPYIVFFQQIREPQLAVAFDIFLAAAELVLGRAVAPSEVFRPQQLLREARSLFRAVR